jgi:hypothetical protein
MVDLIMLTNPTYKVIPSDTIGDRWEKRYVVVDTETGKMLDDAQGYGYKSAQKAHAAYAYKHEINPKIEKRKLKLTKSRRG